jgi:hypothetical protein
MPHLPTLETSTWVTSILRSPATAVRQLDSNFVPHEVSLMILCNALFRSLSTVKFLDKVKNGYGKMGEI